MSVGGGSTFTSQVPPPWPPGASSALSGLAASKMSFRTPRWPPHGPAGTDRPVCSLCPDLTCYLGLEPAEAIPGDLSALL